VTSIYTNTAALAFKRAVKAWPVAFSVVLYAVVFRTAAMLVTPLGIVGGFVLALVGAACASGYLYLLSQAVDGVPLRLSDVKRSFGALFWDVISVFFALWIISLASTVLVRGAGPNGAAIGAFIGLVMAFFFNAVPEMLYQGRTRSFQLLLESGRFVLAHPLSWFLPNVLFAILLLAPTGALAVGHPGELLLLFSAVFSPAGVARIFSGLPLWAAPLLLLFLHYVMVFRGLLYRELTSSNPRLRAWQSHLRG
jgi:hypothetical protein